MRKFLFYISVVAVFCACGDVERTPKPDPFFEKDKMSNILMDMYLIEGSQNSNRRSFLKTAIRPDSFLYKKYKMDSLSYMKNFNYYTDRVEMYNEVLEITQSKLQALEDSILFAEKAIQEQQKEDQKIKDSLSLRLAKPIRKELLDKN